MDISGYKVILARICSFFVLFLTIGLTVYVFYSGKEKVKEKESLCESSSIPCDGLIGWYNSSSFDNVKGWNDLSGNENTLIIKEGLPRVEKNYIVGTKDDYLFFPKDILNEQYTLIHVSRYNGPIKGRIIQSVDKNWLSGHHLGDIGASYQEGWITRGKKTEKDTFSLFIDQKSRFRFDNSETFTNEKVNVIPQQLSINFGHSQPSDWAIGEILIYNRILESDEIDQIKMYTRDKFKLPIAV